jgi:5-methylcytosine-specific restriction protein A
LISQKANVSKPAWDHAKRSRHARGYGKEHEAIRAELLRTVILCEECTRQGRVTPGVIADHVIPLAKGGTGDRSNYQLLCRSCASKKDAIDRGAKRRPRIALDGWPVEE